MNKLASWAISCQHKPQFNYTMVIVEILGSASCLDLPCVGIVTRPENLLHCLSSCPQACRGMLLGLFLLLRGYTFSGEFSFEMYNQKKAID